MKQIHWATVIVATLALIVLGTLAVWGRSFGLPEEAHSNLLAFLGAVGMMVLAYMRSVLDGDPLGLIEDEDKSEDE